MGKLKFVVQGFDEENKVIDVIVGSSVEQVREETEKLVNRGAKEIVVSVTELGAY